MRKRQARLFPDLVEPEECDDNNLEVDGLEIEEDAFGDCSAG